MTSIGKVLDDSKGLGSGFDFLRIALSLGVVSIHAFQLSRTDGFDPPAGPIFLVFWSVLVMFFGLSGFLITGSALRLSLKNFLINRGLRIFPALAVEVILSAMILGPLFTVLPLSEYFTDHHFYLYFSNLLGAVYYHLPGVFDGGWVNGSIWTVPYEIGCYAIISVLIYYGLLMKKWVVVAFALVIMAIEGGLVLWGYRGQPEIARTVADVIRLAPANAIDYLFYSRGARLLVAFPVGIAFYLYRYKIPYSKAVFALAVAYLLVVEAIGQWQGEQQPMANVFLVVPVIYITIFLGISKIPTLPLIHKGDYSYGIYLYGWPFTQAVKFTFPEQSQNWVFLLLATLVPTLLFAAFSWHLIERPILQLRKKFSFVALQRLAELPVEAAPSPPPAALSTDGRA